VSANRHGRRLLEGLQTLGFVILSLAAWEALCRLAGIPVWLLPSPSRIWTETAVLAPVLPRHLLATVLGILGGFSLAVIVAVPLAIMIVYSPLMRRLLYPPLLMLQSVPKVAVAPLLLIWVGYGMSSNIVIAASTAFFPIIITTSTGLQSVDSDLLDLTRSFRPSALKIFWKVRLPWAMPYFFSSLKVAITFAVIGAVVAEFIGSDKGLGYLILASSGNMNTAAMFGVLVILSVVGVACFYAVVLCERVLCPWYTPAELA
jgi:NitT/TauT family transport system permease protein